MSEEISAVVGLEEGPLCLEVLGENLSKRQISEVVIILVFSTWLTLFVKVSCSCVVLLTGGNP